MATIHAFRTNGTLFCSYNLNDLKQFELRIAIRDFRLLPEGEHETVWTSYDKLADYKAPEIFILDLCNHDRTANKQPNRYFLLGFNNDELAQTAFYSKL